MVEQRHLTVDARSRGYAARARKLDANATEHPTMTSAVLGKHKTKRTTIPSAAIDPHTMRVRRLHLASVRT